MKRTDESPVRLGRYELHGAIASGGMATIHLGRLEGDAGFARTVAIKRLHPHYATDPDFVSMLVDEARLAARIRHPNVVTILDAVSVDGELFVVMEYVPGESLAGLMRVLRARGSSVPLPIAASIIAGVLHGLHAAHEATSERGQPLSIVHRDVSPQNLIVGTDGVARVLDFGIAKAAVRIQTTRDGAVKGKLRYIAPEVLLGRPITRRVDVYAAGVVLWEALTGRPLFAAESEGATYGKVLEGHVPGPSRIVPALAGDLDDLVLRALDRDTDRRFATARDMAVALQAAAPIAPAHEVGEWVEQTAGESLRHRAQAVARLETGMGGAPAVLSGPASMVTETVAPAAAAAPAPVVQPAPALVPGPEPSIDAHAVSLGRRRRARLWPAALAAALGAGGLGWALARERADSAADGAASAVTTTEPRAAPAAAPDPSPAPSERASAAVEASAARTAATVSSTSVAPSATPKPLSKRLPTSKSCDPAWIVDGRGILVPKPGCAAKR
jgi:serine/threonine-protein kinase